MVFVRLIGWCFFLRSLSVNKKKYLHKKLHFHLVCVCVVYLMFSYYFFAFYLFFFLLVHWNIFVNATAPVNEKEMKMTKLMSVSTWPITKKKRKTYLSSQPHTLCVIKHGISSGCLRFEKRLSTGHFIFFLLFFLPTLIKYNPKKRALIEGVVWCSFSSLSTFRL